METIEKIIEFFQKYEGQSINWLYLLIALLLFSAIYGSIEYVEVRVKNKRDLNPVSLVCQIFLSSAIVAIFNLILSGISIILGILVALPVTLLVKNKYFSFLVEEQTVAKEIKEDYAELNRLKKLFKSNPHYSILEVLLYYGYISPNQKEYVETNNIFKTPEEMAEMLLSQSVLTPDQLDEAKAIMNMVRREGRVLTKQEALLAVSKLKGGQEDEVDSN